MVKIDENQEVIALIRMAVDNDKKAQALQSQLDADVEYCQTGTGMPGLHSFSEQHWTFGSQSGTKLNSRELEKKFAPSDRDFVSFDERLRSFITHSFPDEAPYYEDLIYVCSLWPIVTVLLLQFSQVQSFKCVKILYQSMEDWTEGRDILRCNPDFHNHERYDCVIINDDSPATTVIRLRSLLRCQLSSGKVIDMALVHTFKWKPDTMWNNCQIYTEAKDSSFVLMDYVVRGALLCPVFNSDARQHYLMDIVDGDMFLRVNNLSWYILDYVTAGVNHFWCTAKFFTVM